MEFCCRNKFNHCPHAQQVLMHTKAELVKGTVDKKWGSGLNAQHTKECHPDHWPGDNHLGRIFMAIRRDYAKDWESQVSDEERPLKRKPTSLMEESSSKRLQ